MSKFNNYPCTKENIRRNLDLWNDRQHGFTYQQLSDKYRITKERCRQIYLRIERKGKWIMNKTSARGRNYTCTNCKKVSRNKFDFCPNCGADMRGDNNDAT